MRTTVQQLQGAPSFQESESQALRDRIAELEDAIRARDDFLAIAAHELRSPLNTLALRLAMLEKIAGADPRLLHEIGRARRAAERYVRRSVVLLDITRLNAGDLSPSPVPIDVRTLVEEVIDDHADEAAIRKVSLAGVVESDGTGQWDAHMIEQVLSNLVHNAVKYGEGAPVQLRARVRCSVAEFEVIDQGPGIGAEHRERIFGKFERLVQGERYEGGYGLGLWIVGSMVAAHGGSVEVESAPGQGTLFRVKLPLERQAKDVDDKQEG